MNYYERLASIREKEAIKAGHPEWLDLPRTRAEAYEVGTTLYFDGSLCARKHVAPHQRAGGSLCDQCEHPTKYGAKIRLEVVRKSIEPEPDEEEENELVQLARALAATEGEERFALAILVGEPELADLPTSATAAEARGINRFWTARPCAKGHLSARRISSGTTSCLDCELELSSSEAYRASRVAHMKERRATDADYRAYTVSKGAERRATKLQATPRWLTKDQHAAIRTFYEDAGCRPSRHAVDHIIPLNHPDVCGLHVPWNLQVLSRTANSEKSNKFDGTMENNGWQKTSTSDCNK